MTDIRQDWINQMEEGGFKFFVIKVKDFLTTLRPIEAELFSNMLELYNEERSKQGKPEAKYWILNRKYYNFESIEDLMNEVKERKIVDEN